MSGWLFCALLTRGAVIYRSNSRLPFIIFDQGYSCHSYSFAPIRLNPTLFTLPSTFCLAILSSLSQIKISGTQLFNHFILFNSSSPGLDSCCPLAHNHILCQDQWPSSTDFNLRKLFLRIKDELWNQFGAVYNKKNMTWLRCCVQKNTFDDLEQGEKSVG